MVGYCGGVADHPTYTSVCAQFPCERGGHAEAIKVEWDPAITNYDKLLRTYISSYSGGSRFQTQYKCAIWWHDEAQREKARVLRRNVTVIWATIMTIVLALCIVFIVMAGTSSHRFWILLGMPIVAFFFPGQLDVLPSCPWYDAEEYHQKYMQKNRGY